MRGQSFRLVNAAIKYEVAVCPFSCDTAEMEGILLLSTIKRSILCVAQFRRGLKYNLSPSMNFGLYTGRHSNGQMTFALSS
jgi:hypothetical protein